MSLTVLQRRMTCFQKWIATPRDTEDEIRSQADRIRSKIKAKAQDDALTVTSTPNSGSFAKRTGLRRHLRGRSVVEGQDVDLPFVVKPTSTDEERLPSLLARFERYAREAYPDTDREPTKSSIVLKFSNRLRYDLVPVLATADPERQILIRTDGDRRETSLQKHVEFTRARTTRSGEVAGAVSFNRMGRLFKWWRCFRQDQSSVLEDVPSYLVDLLCAHAFDLQSVHGGYAQTFADWSGRLARTVRKRDLVAFDDYSKPPTEIPGNPIWAVLDPVNHDNNLVGAWGNLECDELADWLDDARDSMYEVIVAHEQDLDAKGLDILVTLFGTPFRHHCEEE